MGCASPTTRRARSRRRREEIVLGRGAELQRVLYAIAAKQLVPDNPRVIARLVFLGTDQPQALSAA